MSATESSILLLLLMGGLGSVAGYLLRIVQKIEDRRDEIYLKNLPSLYYNIYSFKILVEDFHEGYQLPTLKTNIKRINDNLAEQTFSGYILLFEPDIQKMITEFYENSKKFEADLEQFVDTDKFNEKAGLIRTAFKTGKGLKHTNPQKLLEDLNDIDEKIKSKLESYRSYSYYLLLSIFILGVVAAMIDYFKGLL